MSTFTKSFCNEMDRNIDSNRHNRYTFIQITVNTDKCIDCRPNYVYRDRWQLFRFRLQFEKTNDSSELKVIFR